MGTYQTTEIFFVIFRFFKCTVDEMSTISSNNDEFSGIKVVDPSWRRWPIIILFALNGCHYSFQWLMYLSCATVISQYYNVSTNWVTWTCTIALVLFVILIIPITFVIDQVSTRKMVLIGCCFNLSGAFVKVFAFRPSHFSILFIGQALSQVTWTILNQIGGKLANQWCPENEISIATAVCVSALYVGCGLGSFIPTMIVSGPTLNLTNENNVLNQSSQWTDTQIQEVQSQIIWMHSVSFGIVSITMILLGFLFRKDQDGAPNLAEARRIIKVFERQEKEAFITLKEKFKNFLRAVIRIVSRLNFIALMFSYAFNRGSFYAIYILAGKMVKPNLPDEQKFDQKVGLAVMFLFIVGFAGSLFAGYLIDRYKKYKLIALIWSFSSLVTFGLFVAIISFPNIILFIICCAFLGFFLIGLVPISFGFSGEMAYPESEATSSAILISCGDLLGVVIIETSKYLISLNQQSLTGPLITSIFLIICLSIGLILMTLVEEDLKRFNAGSKMQVQK